MKMRTLGTLIVACMLLVAAQAGAAVITWGTAQDISGESDAQASGAIFGAYGGSGGVASMDINGVVFGNNPTAEKLNINGTYYSSFAGNYAAATPEYDDLLLRGAAGATTITLGVGNTLSIGQEYRVQVWAHDDRNYSNRKATLTSGANVVVLDLNDLDTIGGKGQWVTGTFIANAQAQYITVSGGGSHSAGQVINAVSLHAIPEPATLSMVGFVGAGIFLIRRKFMI